MKTRRMRRWVGLSAQIKTPSKEETEKIRQMDECANKTETLSIEETM